MKKIIKWCVIAACILCIFLGIGGYVVYRNRAAIASKAMNYAMQSLTGSPEDGSQTWLGGLLEGDSAKDVKNALIGAVLNRGKTADSGQNAGDASAGQNKTRRTGLPTMADMLVNGVNDGEKADLGQMAQALLVNLSGGKTAEHQPAVHDINARDTKGRTLLMNVCRVDVTPKVIKMLLRYGADVNAVDEQGRSALMYAIALNENPAVVEMLLENGANANLKDMNGKSVWDYTKTEEMQELVEKYIAKNGWF
ncbi:MAG: ankyrin repeat domain-containing protein [Alphaproteobacteria bacterium]|nr:ankyrin repeat domain-containing protein [Alphaproteobacteria bacterium]